MYISSLTLRNFRNFKKSRLIFKDGINTIIGENGSGKTNLFYALRLLLDDSLPRNSTANLNDTDFCRVLDHWEGHWIVLSVEFADLDIGEDAQAMALHTCGHMDTADKGSFSVFFRPKLAIRQQLFEFSEDVGKSVPGLEEILNSITLEDYESVAYCRGTADFSQDETYVEYVGDFATLTFPSPVQQDEELGVPQPANLSIHREVSCTFIKLYEMSKAT